MPWGQRCGAVPVSEQAGRQHLLRKRQTPSPAASVSDAWAEGCERNSSPGVMPDAVSRGVRGPLLLTGALPAPDSAGLSPSPGPVPGGLLCPHLLCLKPQIGLEELVELAHCCSGREVWEVLLRIRAGMPIKWNVNMSFCYSRLLHTHAPIPAISHVSL